MEQTENKKTNKKEKYVKVCPKCNSIDISVDLKMAWLGESSTSTCNECGYTNTFFPEVEVSKLKDFMKKGKN